MISNRYAMPAIRIPKRSFAMKIYTLTLNPAYDVHAVCDDFSAGHENLAHILSREAGGKGVNISRALTENGIANTAVIVLGKDNCGDFLQDLEKAGLTCVLLEKEGRIRENLTLHGTNGPETRISFSGFNIDDSILSEVENAMEVDADTVITFTGRIGAGMSMTGVKAFLAKASLAGAKIVLDSKSFSLEDIYEVRPWLIKPNQEEISEYFGCPINTVAEAAAKAAALAEHGVVNVMISLGEQGAMLLTGGKLYIAKPPVIHAVSTIGAGDSTIAGFIAAAGRGADTAECLKTAVSFGTAACLTEGSQPPRRADVQRIFPQVEITESCQ